MSNAAEKQRWTCPGCRKTFVIAVGKKYPEFCPACRESPPFPEIAEQGAAAAPDVPAVKESLADPSKAKWRPLAVVLPQTELDDLSEASEGMRERRYYADLAWRVTRFWFVLLYGPAALASWALNPVLGAIACMVWVVIVIALSVPASGALRE